MSPSNFPEKCVFFVTKEKCSTVNVVGTIERIPELFMETKLCLANDPLIKCQIILCDS